MPYEEDAIFLQFPVKGPETTHCSRYGENLVDIDSAAA
jgi:hypothetical protein